MQNLTIISHYPFHLIDVMNMQTFLHAFGPNKILRKLFWIYWVVCKKEKKNEENGFNFARQSTIILWHLGCSCAPDDLHVLVEQNCVLVMLDVWRRWMMFAQQYRRPQMTFLLSDSKVLVNYSNGCTFIIIIVLRLNIVDTTIFTMIYFINIT